MSAYAVQIAAEFACANLAYSASVSASLEVNIYKGISSATKIAPAIICSCPNSVEMYKDTGIFRITTHIKIKEMGISGSISNIAGVMWRAFSTPDVINNLNNQSNTFKVIDILDTTGENTVEGDAWDQTMSFELIGGLAQ